MLRVALSASHVARAAHILGDHNEAASPSDTRCLLQEREGTGASVVEHKTEEREIAGIILLRDVMPVEEAL